MNLVAQKQREVDIAENDITALNLFLTLHHETRRSVLAS